MSGPIEGRVRIVRRRSALRAGVAAALLCGLSACSWVPDWANPIEWYRDATGASKNDPTGDEPNTQNLESGSVRPYPNLASVPPPPTNALSAADREKLQKSLLADRQNAKYVEEGQQYAAVAPESARPPAGTAPIAELPAAGSTPGGTPTAARPPTAPVAELPPAGSTPGGTPTAEPPPTAPNPPSRGGEAPPQESSLTTPSVRSVPTGEPPREPPSPPDLAKSGAAAPRPTQSAALTPPARPDAGATRPSKIAPAVSVNVGLVEFAGSSSQLAPDARQRLHEVAQLYRQSGGRVRVIGYSEAGPGPATANREISAFNLALDRARAVALALIQMGIPAGDVAVDASPPPSGEGGGTVEIALEY